ncbi:MAG TPA: HAD family acid phosphatase [Gemmatimonadales bacterium]|jgi:5'-nucleotidase (lipoprotein e(P4) family)
MFLIPLLMLSVAPLAPAQQTPLQVTYVQSSEEYAALTRMVYREAARAVRESARRAPRGRWAVVLDLDETTLDNSDFERDRIGPFTPQSWSEWTAKRAALAVPGVQGFIAEMRRLGGHIAWITDRDTPAREDTRENLRTLGLWSDDDRLCVRTDPVRDPKAARRRAVMAGEGACSWAGRPMQVLGYFGDQLKAFPDDSTADFPGTGESDGAAGQDSAFGSRFFIIPNPTYGRWTQCVTRGGSAAADRRPTLVVAISVDQMRADYLDRFGAQLDGGLHRMAVDGARFMRAYQDHAMSETAPGHASILSGRWPNSTHIVRNSEGVNDSTPLLEVAGEGASPNRFHGTELFDWMHSCWPRSRVLSVSRKDRAAILMVGKAKGDVYWYQGGMFTTSRYYADALPDWVREFDREALAARWPGRSWNLLLAPSQYPESDSMTYENGGRDLVFPHVLPADTNAATNALIASPGMDSLTMALALRGVGQLGLGRGPGADLLVLGLSATDYIGHAWGPDSREMHDQILHLDRNLGVFFDSLAKLVPGRRIVAVLTADHGVTSYPEASNIRGDHGAQALSVSGLVRQVNTELQNQTGVRNGIRYFEIGLLVVERQQLEARGMDVDSLVQKIAVELRAMPQVQRIDTPGSLARADTATDDVARRWIHLIPPGLPAELMVTLKQNMVWGSGGSAQHGQPSEDDTHVPLLFWGRGIRTGRYTGRVGVVDIAPTLAAILGVVPDPAVQGRALREAVAGER